VQVIDQLKINLQKLPAARLIALWLPSTALPISSRGWGWLFRRIWPLTVPEGTGFV